MGSKIRLERNPMETKKRRPPVRIADRLLPHLRRWRQNSNHLYIITWDGPRIGRLRRSFSSEVELAGLDAAVTPHVLRHTCTTWLMQKTGDAWATGGFVGMSPGLVERVCGRHSPDYQSKSAGAFSTRSDTGIDTGRRKG